MKWLEILNITDIKENYQVWSISLLMRKQGWELTGLEVN